MKHLDNEIEKTMNSLDDIQRVASNPFLWSRIEARLSKKNEPIFELNWQFGLKVALATLLLIFNVLTISSLSNRKDAQNQPPTNFDLSEKISDYQYEVSI